jgi:hypothetical protein
VGEHLNTEGTAILWVSCDAPGCSAELAFPGNFTMGPTPHEWTGWTTNEKKGDERRYFCPQHGDEGRR